MPEGDRRPRRWTPIVIAAVFLSMPVVTWLTGFVTEYLWFADVGHSDVFVITLTSKVAVAFAFGVVAFGLLFVNARIARRMAPRAMLHSVGEMPPQIEEAVLRIRAKAGPVLDAVILWGSIAAAVLIGLAMVSEWDVVRLALAAVPFGVKDPQFGRDVAFYIFTLPLLRMVADWMLSMLIITTIVTAAVHFADGAIQPWARWKGFAPHVKAHLSVLLGLVVATKAFDYYLDIYELNFSPRGQVTGASYTDVHAQAPALKILIVIALLSAAVLLFNIRNKGWRLPLIALGTWLAASLLIGQAYPALVQQFRVRPNEIEAEAPYIARNIAATREAFGLTDVETRPFPAAENLTAEAVIANRDTLENVRLWDPQIATQSYRQLQIIRQYYDFKDVDIDRYEIEGNTRQLLVSARELDINDLPEQAKTWVNQHLYYTHGYGLVMSPVNESDGRGLPKFILGDIPPVSDAGLDLERPAIYFGEDTDNYIIVNTDQPEFDYPVGNENAETNYEGDTGVSIGSMLRRIMFAIRFGDAPILFSDALNADSRILYDRDIRTRVARLAPWLWLDDDPYPVLVDGRIVWVMDGYTWSSDYPYSEPWEGINYVRNSVKVTVDAYDGTTTLYAFDPDDPVLKAWGDIFPGLLTPAEEIPDAVRAHFRYPEDLFTMQAKVFRNYHMTDPQVFYNKEDSWQLPGEREAQGPMDPFYVLMTLPGETTEDFQMIIPFTPINRDNMIGWMSAKSDPEDYGKRTVYQFPKQKVILGPQQVSARINQDEVISPQISLWSQRGSQVLFGNMLVIPLEESIVYIQPLYLQAEETAIPELTRVIVVYADKVEMAPDLESALLAVFGEEPEQAGPSGEEGAVGELPVATIRLAEETYQQALEAQKAGDWAEYGRQIEELGRILSELSGAVESLPQTATP